MINFKLHFDTQENKRIKEYRSKIEQEAKSGNVGYFNLPFESTNMINSIEKIKKDTNHKNIVLIGVGGSSLGAKAIASMLSCQENKTKNLYFLENTDPLTTLKTLSLLELNETLFIVASKSGATIETISLFKIVLNYFQIDVYSDDFKKHLLIITDKNSPLDNFANELKLNIFYTPENVGGRFSALSAMGLAPLGIAGYDINSLLNGALSCYKDFFENKNDTIIKKAYHYCSSDDVNINVLFSYGDLFREFNAWYIQLWAESLGKLKDGIRIGLTPIGLIGSIDQHSFLQLIMEGPKDKSVTFLHIKDFETNLTIPNINLPHLQTTNFVNGHELQKLIKLQCKATMQSVIEEGVFVDEIEIEKLDAFHVGYLIYYFELLTSSAGLIFGINTYNQPGVEIGKKILKKLF